MSGFDFASAYPGYEIPGYWPDTSNLIFPAHQLQFPGYPVPGYDLPGQYPIFVIPGDPVVFTNELMEFIASKIGYTPFPNKLPQGNTTYPLIVYNVVDGDSIMNLATPAGIGWLQIQFTFWSQDSIGAALLEVKLLNLLRGYRGVMGRAFCQGAFAERYLTTYQQAVNQSDDGTYGIIRDYRFWFTEPD